MNSRRSETVLYICTQTQNEWEEMYSIILRNIDIFFKINRSNKVFFTTLWIFQCHNELAEGKEHSGGFNRHGFCFQRLHRDGLKVINIMHNLWNNTALLFS